MDLGKEVANCVLLSGGAKMGLRHAPFGFTGHGVLMLSNVLRSKHAIAMSIRIIHVFMRTRKVLAMHKDLLLEVENLRGSVSHYSRDIKVIFNRLKRMEQEERNRRLPARVRYLSEAKETKQHRPVVGFKKDKPGK